MDLVIKQGDTTPTLTATILDQAGAVYDLTGCTVQFVMRALTSSTPVVNAAATVTNAANGAVSYSWTATDTATPGFYMGTFRVTTGTAATFTFPNDGYLEIEIEDNLTAAGVTQLVTLGDAKDVLNIPSTDRTQDAKILRFVHAARPLVESITGPIVSQQFEEWHDGGGVFISLRHRPSAALGASPFITLQAVSEYNGPIEWPLSIIASPDQGQLYSVQLDAPLGRVVRRTAGGGVQPFPTMTQAVHVWYTAGQQTVPANVYEGTLELIRVNYQQTQQGRPRANQNAMLSDEETARTAPLGFFMPGRVREMLAPNRRFPSIA